MRPTRASPISHAAEGGARRHDHRCEQGSGDGTRVSEPASRREAIDVEGAFRAHERSLWGMVYRLTGSAADADEIVQETFLRVLERPPDDATRPLKPWLVRVAMNLGLDSLRRRKRRPYTGPWLPSPVESTGDDGIPSFEPVDASGVSTEGRYDLLESVSMAFLIALEALRPRQRAVLLLRDVFDYSVEETADALGISSANVKTTHHRARHAMAAYDHARQPITRARQDATRDVLGRFVLGLATRDVAEIEKLLAADVREMSDGGGEFLSALNPLFGANVVARFFVGLARRVPSDLYKVEMRTLNGLPALLVDVGLREPRLAPRFIVGVDLDSEGRIREAWSVQATRKLTHVFFPF
jgi:RNA polymerase sigma-70 factor (ECF subfamily)